MDRLGNDDDNDDNDGDDEMMNMIIIITKIKMFIFPLGAVVNRILILKQYSFRTISFKNEDRESY
jgi:hypothetical protein